MPGPLGTSLYNVHTSFTSDASQAVRETDRYERAMGRASMAQGIASRQSLNLGRGLRMVAFAAGPAMAGFVGLGAAAMGLMKTFQNLNQEQNAVIQTASQVNLAFQFERAVTPVENFNLSMAASREMVRGLTKDAAALPGELADFLQIQRAISGGVFAGGGDLARVRAMTARIALFAPAAGQSAPDAGRQAMSILFGQAGLDRPLFAALKGTGLLPDAQTFNALPAAERLRVFDEALQKFTDNPAFRKEILGTFDTQIGTLADTLFGVEGILARMGARGLFDDLLQSLIDLNHWLENNQDDLVRGFKRIFGSTGGDLALERALRGFVVERKGGPGSVGLGIMDAIDWANQFGQGNAVRTSAANRLYNELLSEGRSREQLSFLFGGDSAFRSDPELRRRHEDLMVLEAQKLQRRVEEERVKLSKGDDDLGKLTPKDVPQSKVTQNFTIKLDLKSDDAPDAVALRIRKAMEKVGRHRTTTARAAKAATGSSSMSP